MNHRVPALRCLAGKSGLASLIIARARAPPVPGVSPTLPSRAVFLPSSCLFAHSSRFILLLQPKPPVGSGWAWGLWIPPWGLPGSGGRTWGTHLARWAARPWQPAGVCGGALAMPGAQAWVAWAQISQSRKRVSVTKQDKWWGRGTCWEQGSGGLCAGAAETRQVPERCCSVSQKGSIFAWGRSGTVSHTPGTCRCARSPGMCQGTRQGRGMHLGKYLWWLLPL